MNPLRNMNLRRCRTSFPDGSVVYELRAWSMDLIGVVNEGGWSWALSGRSRGAA